MSDTATLSRLFASIESDLDVVEATFHERATSGLEMLNTAAEKFFAGMYEGSSLAVLAAA